MCAAMLQEEEEKIVIVFIMLKRIVPLFLKASVNKTKILNVITDVSSFRRCVATKPDWVQHHSSDEGNE